MKIVLGISGSIAAYKAPLIVREILKRGDMHDIRVVMTPSATRFIPAITLQNLTKYPVAVEMFDEEQQSGGSWHIHLARWCDVMMIAPCSATTLAKLAHGIADTALTAVALALPHATPLLLAPAMDTEMWVHRATQRNCAILQGDGVQIVPPTEGELASGLVGLGRLPEPHLLVDILMQYARGQYTTPAISPSPYDLFEEYKQRFDMYAHRLSQEAPKRGTSAVSSASQSDQGASQNNDTLQQALETPVISLQAGAEAVQFDAELELTKLKQQRCGETDSNRKTTPLDTNNPVPLLLAGKTVLITAGPTYERIDDVRFIGNYSSGKMGFALAEEAARSGADVTLIAGPVSLQTPMHVKRIDVESAREMFDEVMKYRAEADIIILAAAVADFMPQEQRVGKIKKEEVGDTMTLQLTKTPDILAAVGAVKADKQIVVGFALEAQNHLDNAHKKMVAKHADMMVLNALGKPQSGFGADDNTITILTPNQPPRDFPPMPKTECARVIIREIAALASG
ncbi:MAG: bifunctional phosphopantothenoylcysteine decarboxylase/phosphopantothenate synthase [Bacteroidota bacterium]|nr:bifunctional phosphopantothenoylcysteine decarboxylase/phosphopantothenate synthase [Candidatus Kapabacteria bacterium]MDW8219135.1 bifunctional phosphopantothenoylcysteine decarboxylase/phosphopantothenate synthase [Bacteroidota bacterium]